VKRYRAAIEYQSEFYQADASLGYALKEMGEFGAALTAYAKSLALRLQYTPAIEYLAETHLALGEIDKATAAYSKLVELDPQEQKIYWPQSITGWQSRPKRPVAIRLSRFLIG
jgi:tetratricopeptide (TPR) repeat protein